MANDAPLSDSEIEEMNDSRYALRIGLSAEDRKAAHSAWKSWRVHTKQTFCKKGERQAELLEIRQWVRLLRRTSQVKHAGFLALLDEIESDMDLEIDSYRKGYIER